MRREQMEREGKVRWKSTYWDTQNVLWRVFTHSFSFRWQSQIERKDHLYYRSIYSTWKALSLCQKSVANVLQFIVKDQTHEKDAWKKRSRKYAVCGVCWMINITNRGMCVLDSWYSSKSAFHLYLSLKFR